MSRKGKKRGRAGTISPTSGHSGGKKKASRAATLADELKQGLALQQRGLIPEAKSLYENYLRRHPTDGDALHLLGLLNFQTQNFEEAVALLGRAAARLPKNPACFNTLGAAMQSLGRFTDAIDQYSTALRLKADYADALDNRGRALRSVNRHGEALADFDRLTRLQPQDADAWLNRGLALSALRRLEEALDSFDRTLQINPRSAQAYFEQGNVHGALRAYAEADRAYEQALALDPTIENLQGASLHTRQHLCAWDGFERRRDALIDAIRSGQKGAGNAWELLALVDDPAVQKSAADSFAPRAQAAPITSGSVGEGSKLRIAYYSADFNEHATSRLIVEMIEAHDRDHFEVIGVSFLPADNKPLSLRMAAAFDEFVEVQDKSDREVVDWSRGRGIDIAIDLKGNTAWSRPRLFALGCAPIQVAYLGYPGTFAAGRIDYILADAVVIPPGSDRYFTERVVRLPQCYQPNDSKRAATAPTEDRAHHGLPDKGVVFASMNNPYKILPEIYASWMSILRDVENSVLWLLSTNADAEANLLDAAEAANIDRRRIIFAPKVDFESHMARYPLADLILDTWPCNGHTTGSDALWAGVPIITRAGRCFASRVGASLLTTLGMPELITETDDAYRSLAIAVGNDRERRMALRQRLADLKTTTPLFRSTELVTYIEAAYRAMAERHNSGGQPSALAVNPDGVVTFDDPA